MRLAVTGATGYVGRRLVQTAILKGHAVLALSRRPLQQPGVQWQAFDLGEATPLNLSPDVDALIHLAADTTGADCLQQELVAAGRLALAAHEAGARFIFVSSQTARADALTVYGRTKWAIEQAILPLGGIAVRPGLVYGGEERGLFGALCRSLRRSMAVPLFFPAPCVQPIHVDDLIAGLLKAPTLSPSTVVCVGEPSPIPFHTFLATLARGRLNHRLLWLPVPQHVISVLARCLGPTLSDKLGVARLCSLFTLPTMETADDLARIGVALRPVSSGVTKSGSGRRYLLREAQLLLQYLLKDPAPPALQRRYVRALEALGKEAAVPVAPVLAKFPCLVALLEGAAHLGVAQREELASRLNVALLIAESSPLGASRFLGAQGSPGVLSSVWRLFRALFCEILRRVGQMLLLPLLWRAGAGDHTFKQAD